jgi:hypothetical protein
MYHMPGQVLVQFGVYSFYKIYVIAILLYIPFTKSMSYSLQGCTYILLHVFYGVIKLNMNMLYP